VVFATQQYSLYIKIWGVGTERPRTRDGTTTFGADWPGTDWP